LGCAVRRADGFVRAAFIAEVEVRQDRDVVSLVFVLQGNAPQDHEPPGVAECEWAKQRAIDETEDEGIGADSERQGERRDNGEAGLLEKQPKPVEDVLPESHAAAVLLSTTLPSNRWTERSACAA